MTGIALGFTSLMICSLGLGIVGAIWIRKERRRVEQTMPKSPANDQPTLPFASPAELVGAGRNR